MLNESPYVTKTEAHLMRLLFGMAILGGISIAILMFILLIQAPLVALTIVGFPAICYGLGWIAAYIVRRNNAKNGE